jgi:hypothetical protein
MTTCATCRELTQERDALALRDGSEEIGPLCVSCAVDQLADLGQIPDVHALRLEPWRCPCWWWARESDELERRDQPPGWAVDGELWSRALDALRARWRDYHLPWSVTSQLYRALGGRVAT